MFSQAKEEEESRPKKPLLRKTAKATEEGNLIHGVLDFCFIPAKAILISSDLRTVRLIFQMDVKLGRKRFSLPTYMVGNAKKQQNWEQWRKCLPRGRNLLLMELLALEIANSNYSCYNHKDCKRHHSCHIFQQMLLYISFDQVCLINLNSCK